MPNIKGRDHDVDKQIGLRLRLLRVDRGLSQQALGDKLGVTFQQIQKYENGSNAIACTRVPRLCEVLHIKPNNLFEGFKFDGSPVPIGAIAMGFGARIEKLSIAKRHALGKFLDVLEGNV
jgi:transcriptional regulator with XRE-family HTH domain